MYCDAGTLIYVGKAKNLKLRLQSYRRVKIGASSKLLRLVHTIGQIQFEVCASEEQALLRENELLRTEKPRFNVVNTRPENHFYFKVRLLTELSSVGPMQIELGLTLNANHDEQSDSCLFGAFSGMALCQKTFLALRRLLWLVNQSIENFADGFYYPLHLYRRQRIVPTVIDLDRFWLNELSGFFHGFSSGKKQVLPLVNEIAKILTRLPGVDSFHQNWLTSDLEVLKRFYVSSSARNLRLKRNSFENLPIISQAVLDDLISTAKFRR